LYFFIYFILSFIYRYVLINYEESKVVWELFCIYCEKFSKVIPISFLLGFYVTQVVSRWWAQFMSLPWPDTLARFLAVYLPGTDKKSRHVRRTVIRWVNLGNLLALRLVSYKVMMRFPTYEHLIEAGLATQKEIIQLKHLDEAVHHRHQVSWYPFMWAQNLLRDARKEGLISNDWFTHVLIKEIDNIANMNGMLICYAWISIPLVYTQVVTLAVYAYFIACMFGRQYLLPTQYIVEGGRYVPVSEFPKLLNWTETTVAGATNVVGYDNHVADFFVPCFTILEYLFYLGWLKVAETLLNPFGEDDDDFDTYYLIDRNLQVSLLMLEEAGRVMEMEVDPLNDTCPAELNHTVMSAQYLDDARPRMPTDGIVLGHEQAQITDSTRNSRASLNMGSKLNLAGSMLSTPILGAYKKRTFLMNRRNTVHTMPKSVHRTIHKRGYTVHSDHMQSVSVKHLSEKLSDHRPSKRFAQNNSLTVPEVIQEETIDIRDTCMENKKTPLKPLKSKGSSEANDKKNEKDSPKSGFINAVSSQDGGDGADFEGDW